MSGHEDSRSIRRQFAEKILDHPDSRRVETDHRLIDDDDAGLVKQGRGNNQPLLHAVGIGLDEMIRPVIEGKLDQELLGLLAVESVAEPVEIGDELHELHAGQLFVEEWPVGDETDDALGGLRFRGHRNAADSDGSFRRPEDACHHPDRCCFSGAVGTDETENLPLGDFEVQIVHRHGLAVQLGQMCQFDHRSISRISSFNLPISPTRSICRSASPRTKRMCVTSAGICPRTASAVTQPPRSFR